jgi:NADH-quinone oxidoreductase subunit G
MPKCTINGQEIEVKQGATIIEAMYANDQSIAHYCYHPGLSVAGVCRLCVVEIEGNPRPQIACNTVVTEGMKINNTSEKIKDTVKWGLDFHLINHPLDCPICDQAGECGLQDQYMEFGKYNPEMAERKVKKKKVVDLGPTVVLDSERCILCARCTRFTSEVTKTDELGIFNRGDRSEIGCFEGKKLENKYSLNTVDICPVGALTSKDFRFRQRVWYLKDSETVCNGCATGCNVNVFYNKEGMFRVKPAYNEKINGWWMCDEGRNIYKFVNKENRLLKAKNLSGGSSKEMNAGAAAKEVSSVVKGTSGDKLALVLTAQYTVEEYDAVVKTFVEEFKSKNIFFWVNNPKTFDTFDGLLIRGDKNPNTKGLLKVLEKYGISATWNQLEEGLQRGQFETVVVAGPENQYVFPDIDDKSKLLSKVKNLIWLTAGMNSSLEALPEAWLIPMKTFVEKEGTFINYAGIEQRFKKVTNVVSDALTLTEAALLLAGKNLTLPPVTETFINANRPPDQVTLEHRKKNEFVFRRGTL